MIEVNEAEMLIGSSALKFGVESVSILDAKGRILATDIKAERAGPPFDRVAMDGIGIQYQSISRANEFHCEGMQAAGEPQCKLNQADACIEVMTGAPLPKDCDTVVPFEKVTKENEHYRLDDPRAIKEKQNIHFEGSDYKAGSVLLKKGVEISAPIIAILASEGVENVDVVKYPKFALITTGSELVNIDEVPEPHQIRMSNVYAAFSLLKPFGISSEDRYHIADEELKVKVQLQECLEKADVLILSGGVSKGKKDYVPKVLEELGVEKRFHKISQKPGKPMFFGIRDNKRVFALPGNPVSMVVCMVRYVLPWLKQCLGNEKIKTSKVLLKDEIKSKEKLVLFAPVIVEIDENGTRIANKISVNGSGDFNSLSNSTGFIEVPASGSTYQKNTLYDYYEWGS